MDVVQGHIHDHLTIMPSVLQIISSISVVIWLEHVQSWIFNSKLLQVLLFPPSYTVCGRCLRLSILCSLPLLSLGVSSQRQQQTEVKQVTHLTSEATDPKVLYVMQDCFSKNQTDVLQGKGELIDPSQQKFPKRWPDNRGPVIIRIDGTNLLLMIRKMRSSRPHFKYIFHYRGADKQHC